MFSKVKKRVKKLFSQTTLPNKSWIDKWRSSEKFYSERVLRSELILNYFKSAQSAPSLILDIGCGLAIEAEMIQKSTGCGLYLMDSSPSENEVSLTQRDIGWGSAESMSFYTPMNVLLESFDERKMNYTFVDASSPDIPKNVKFDAIFSFKSCGLHYPLSTYKSLIKSHSHPSTKIIVDLRISNLNNQNCDYTIIKTLRVERKSLLAHIDFPE